ncbi:Ig-like domain-containing protein [Verminephrobacter eiseniae]|uniref:Ig-like domain-containing protein n=2 Tax=Verminephrobacter eiseniae TaxID=364317 RepID=UPI002237DFFF|nr:Ig-like domain-containing protein [Verminephrobacter eiseniae]
MNNDAGGVLAQSAAFTVDNVRPYIVNFDMPSVIPGSGARTTIYVTFSEPVSDDTAGATIFSSAEGGYSRGTPDNGGRTWIYQYWPKAANGTNYIGMYLSTFKDLAGNAGSDDSAQYYVKSMTVDSLKPTVASASIAKSDLRLGEKTTITITFSELVTRSSFTIEDLQVDAGKGTLSNLRVAPSDTTATTTAATTWLVDLEAPATRPATGLDGNQIRINLDGITDVAGNAGSGRGVSLPARYNIDDGLPPTVTIAPAATILRAGETMSVTFTFSEKVTGFGTEDIQYDTSKGTLGALTAVGTDGKVWTATYTPQPGTESANNTIRVNLSGVRDAQDNAGVGTATSGNFSIDTVRPTVNVTISDERLTAGETATITITFSERVTGFTKENIGLSRANGTLGDLTPVGTDGKTWTATFTPTARLERPYPSTNSQLTLNLANVRDAAGNTVANNTYSLRYTVDTMVFALSSATVNRDQLVLGYGTETDLDGNADRAPTNESFTVLVDGTRIDVSRVTVDAAARTVTLTLARAVAAGQQVSIAYQDTDTSDGKALQEVNDGDDAASFAAKPVTNLTPSPVAPATPEASGASGASGGSGGSGGSGALDSDYDSVPNAQEDQAPGLLRPDGSAGTDGDGNGDGIQDSQQVAVGSTRDLTLVAGSQDGKLIPGSNARITELVRSDAPASLPKGMEMPLGLTQFRVGLSEGRYTESFSLYVDPALGVNGYWVKDSTGTWVNLASEPYGGKVTSEGGRTRLDFQIQDGGQYDADGLADGHITALGAAAKMPLSIVGQAPPQVESHGFWF